MAKHGVLIESMIQAKNIDALNRSVVSTVDVDGGNLIALTEIGRASCRERV